MLRMYGEKKALLKKSDFGPRAITNALNRSNNRDHWLVLPIHPYCIHITKIGEIKLRILFNKCRKYVPSFKEPKSCKSRENATATR